MKLEVFEKIWKWLDEGYTVDQIAKTYYINPDIIDMIKLVKNSEVNLDVYG
jgi:hypothetical protein